MNGSTGSTLPARNPITRPVSFHSLSEHNHNNPSYLSPHPHRRPRTPRSSPLAGPSLSPEEADGESKDGEGNQKPRYRPNRISSIPDMAARPQSLYNPDTASFQSTPSTISGGSVGIVVASSASSSSSEGDKEREFSKGNEDVEGGSRLRNFAKRLSIISTSSLATSETDKDGRKASKRRSDAALRSTSTTSLASTSSSRTARTDKTAPPIPAIPRWALKSMHEEAGVANRNSKYGHRRGTSDDLTSSSSLPALPNQPIPRGVPLSTSGLSNHPSTSRDPGENWMSMTDPTPKFSRLGLRGEGVVMPVSKKESLGRMKSSSSMKSRKSTASISQSSGTRRDSGTAIRSEPGPGAGLKSPPKIIIVETDSNRSSSLTDHSRSKIPRISASSTDSENVPPIPPPTNASASSLVSVSNSHIPTSTPIDSASRTINKPPFPTTAAPPNPRRSTSALTAIDENQLPAPNGIEMGVRASDIKSKDAQKTRARRKSIKQIVMRITTAPMSAGEKLKFGAIHKSTPVMVLPPDTLVPPPSATWVGNPASSSVSTLPPTKATSNPSGQGDACGTTGFKSIKKRWNAVLGTVRR